MNCILDKKYPYLTSFFETAIKEKRLFHSLILYGSNVYMQYAVSLELARLLNCTEEGKEDCNCRNCRWIRENKHPAIITISKTDNKSDKDTSKTVISAQQTEMVLDMIFSSSDFKRVFIFCNADIKNLNAKELEEYNEFKKTGYDVVQSGNDNKIWYPSGINKKCFPETSANSMLKSIEEPAGNVTFIFLTNSPNDLISTIVSRSQSFFVPDTKRNSYITGFFDKYFIEYPDFKQENALDFVKTLLNYQNDNNLAPLYIIDCIQFYLIELLKKNNKNKNLINKIFKDINMTQKAKNMINSYIKEAQVYEYLAFYFAKKSKNDVTILY